MTAGLQQRDCCTSLDPHAFVALDGPAFEPCSTCGEKPSLYREKWVKGMTERRRLCRRCYGAAVRREQRAGPPLLGVIDTGALQRVAAAARPAGASGSARPATDGRCVAASHGATISRQPRDSRGP